MSNREDSTSGPNREDGTTAPLALAHHGANGLLPPSNNQEEDIKLDIREDLLLPLISDNEEDIKLNTKEEVTLKELTKTYGSLDP